MTNTIATKLANFAGDTVASVSLYADVLSISFRDGARLVIFNKVVVLGHVNGEGLEFGVSQEGDRVTLNVGGLYLSFDGANPDSGGPEVGLLELPNGEDTVFPG